VASASQGIRIVDLTVPWNPRQVIVYNTPGDACDIAVHGAYAYVADMYGVRAINVENSAAPYEGGFQALPGQVTGIALAEPYLYVAAGDAGLIILHIEIASPTPTPTASSTLTCTPTPRRLYLPLVLRGGRGF